MSQVQIPTDLFRKLCTYFATDGTGKSEELEREIRRELLDKVNRIIERRLYTTYQRAATPDEKDKALREYLQARSEHRDG